MQMHKGKDGAPMSAISMVRSILKAEGPSAFLSGWQASVMREMSYSAIRMGLYDEIKEVLAGVYTGLLPGISAHVCDAAMVVCSQIEWVSGAA
jgi:hypothetical protein